MKTIRNLLTLAFVVSCVIGQAQVRGFQAIGLANYSDAAVRSTSEVMSNNRTSYEVSFLPFTFNNDAPFRQATSLVRQTMPRKPDGRLTMTVYLWFEDWDGRRPYADGTLSSIMRRRIDRTADWIRDTRTWLESNGMRGRMRFVVCPVLEDECGSARQYREFFARVKARFDGRTRPDGYRRSPLDRRNADRIDGMNLEMHGRYTDVSDLLRVGDRWSPDGIEYTDAEDFRRDRRAAAERGVSSLFWTSTFNIGYNQGYARGTQPELRRNLNAMPSHVRDFVRRAFR